MLKGLWEVLEDTDVEISKPEGGFSFWIKLPTGTSTKRLWEAAAKAGISTRRARPFSSTAARSSSAWPTAGSRPSGITRARA